MLKKRLNIRSTFTARRITVMLAAVVIMIIFAVGSYHTVRGVIMKANIAVMEEMAVHDIRSLTNIITDEWDDLDNMCDTMNHLGVVNDERLIKIMQELSRHKENSIICLISEDGTIFQSDGIIGRQDELYDVIMGYDDSFAFCYDNAADVSAEADKQYLLIGKKINGVLLAGHKFTYVFRKADISELDTVLEIESFGGRGHASVIDKNGSYVIYRDRSENATGPDNMFEKMKASRFRSGSSYEKVMEQLEDLPEEGITFRVEYKGADYLINITAMDEVQWYYTSLVPVEVFSDTTYKILRVVWLCIAIIFTIGFISFYRELLSQAIRESETFEQNRKLKAALDAAEEANKAKTVFLRSMSHDIRTPMNAICGFTELAVQYIDNRRITLKYLMKIRESSTHLLELINDILDMSRIESGSVTIHPEKERLSLVLSKIHDLFLPATSKNGQTLKWDETGVLCNNIYCDELRLSQILINIISNAVKYTQNGGEISFWVKQDSISKNDMSTYEFHIKDNGIGMSEEYVLTIFDPFTREQSPENSCIQGTGLGMSITKNLVTLMDGTIECQSSKGLGTEIIVRLPFRTYVEEQSDE